MAKILDFFKNINKNISEVEKHPEFFDSYQGLEKNQIPFNFNFDGTVKWLNTITCSFQSHFLIKDLKSYNYFKTQIQPYGNLSFVELDHRIDQRQLISILEKVNAEKFNNPDIILNLVVFDYEDFYLKLGNKNIDQLFIPLIKNSEVQVSIIENGKAIPFMIKSCLSHKIEWSGHSFYLNDKVFEPCVKKYQEFWDLTKNSLKYNEKVSEYYLFDSFQKKNCNNILSSDFIFYENSEFINGVSYPHKRIDINGQYKYAVCLYKDGEFMCIYDLFSKKIGFIEKEKFLKVFKAKVRLVSKSVTKVS